MKIYSKFNPILFIIFFLLLPIFIKAQQKILLKQDLGNYHEGFINCKKDINIMYDNRISGVQVFKYFSILKDASDQNFFHQNEYISLNKIQLTSDLLDSVVFKSMDYPEKLNKHILTYDNNAKRLIFLEVSKSSADTNWINNRCTTTAYDENMKIEIEEVWDKNDEIWVKYQRDTYTYDNNGNMLTHLYEYSMMQDGQLVKGWRNTYSYDENGNILTFLGEFYENNNGTFRPSEQNTYSYDNKGNIINYLSKYWDSDSEMLENSIQITYEYDISGNLLIRLVEKWDKSLAQWINNGCETYTYDSHGNKLTYLREMGEALVNSDRYTYTYDNDNLITELKEYWNKENTIWLKSSLQTYTYDSNGNVLNCLGQNWNSDWVDAARETYTYDNSGNLMTYLAEIWSINNSEWANFKYYNYTYDNNGNILTFYQKDWRWNSETRTTYGYDNNGNIIHYTYEQKSGSDWYPGNGEFEIKNNGYTYQYGTFELFAYYKTLTSLKESENNIVNVYSLKQNFPNPFNPVSTIEYTIGKTSDVNLTVYNSIGQKVAVLINKKMKSGTHKITFSGTALSSGIYYYRINADNFTKTRKMLLIK